MGPESPWGFVREPSAPRREVIAQVEGRGLVSRMQMTRQLLDSF
ncbi:hypothetical protein [Paucibacter sp. KBW04]|nr:hypothetical protein [Paucibacter sp. KBW04]